MKIEKTLIVVAATLAACSATQRPAPVMTPATHAAFDVFVPEASQPLPVPSPLGTSRRPPCLHSARFSGVVLPGESDARVLLSRGFMNVERHNDKQFDALILRLEVAEPSHSLGAGNTVEYRLVPTVDTAGPSITSWQAKDTVRLLVPWNRRFGARWLLFFLSYHAVARDGTMSECSVILKSDTLRFDSGR